MRKSPRVLAGVIMLALFASVGALTSRAFNAPSVEQSASGQAVTAQTTSSHNWTETRGPTNYK